MFNIAIIAVNEDCEEKEKVLVNFLAEKIAEYKDYSIISFDENYSINQIIDKIKNDADRTVLVYDAVKGFNSAFSSIAAELCYQEIKPILLISSSDEKGADIEEADNSVAEIWKNKNPYLTESQLFFHTLYYSYENKAIDTMPDVHKTNDISALIELIS